MYLNISKPFLHIFNWTIAWCLIFLFLLSSCEKAEENPEPKETPSECRLSKFIYGLDSTKYTTYLFDNQNRILQSKKSTNKDWELTTFNYNASGKLVTINREAKVFNRDGVANDYSSVYLYEYNSMGQIAKYKITQPASAGSKPISETVCSYDSEGNRIKTTTTFENGNTPITNVYTYENGNCVKAVYNYGSSLESTTQYEFYLDKENKHSSINNFNVLMHFMGRTGNKNLLKSETENLQAVDLTLHYQYSYDYNEQGFPIRQYIIYPENFTPKTATYLMEYNCP
ncbi:hypothetical protein AHMF7605_22510 [Adhaeribacter arboris]|uniref:DUF4595 domain-containing protein n=1 Tax=Adhaeribacter arboris TaxID=2072846 RepID=A0A2T2YKN3_9BACT|nr:hypothetical protein [Adhaeribacter arboris]PSR56074.1 hypothetical protein AHMF7605_22510 [Adhaeribacter arboris]